MFVENKKRPIPIVYLYYLVLLLVGIIFTEIPFGESYRKAIAFNLSGPFQLGVMAIFCFKRKVNLNSLATILRLGLLPIISFCSYLWYRTPSLSEIVFNTESNFQTSGGFGPNQVSTLLGYGLFLITILLVSKKYFSGIKLLDWLILAYISFRGLLTFSRGGMIAGFLAIILFAFLYLLGNRNFVLSFSRYIVIGLAFGVGLFFYTSDLTGGKLENRYSNKNSIGIAKQDLSSGRLDIFEAQIGNWVTRPIFGIGVGSGKYMRAQELDGIAIASHNEVTRMVEEHGLIGFLLLILLLVTPIICMKDLESKVGK
jgi:O-antigen ligase